MPPRQLTWHLESQDGLVLITVSGELDAEGGAALRGAVLRCLDGEPDAILVELSAMTVGRPDAAAIFPRMIREAEVWPGTPLLLCAADPATAALVADAAGEPPPFFPTVAAARAALTGRDELISELLLPVPGAARHARNVATEACVRWDLPHLTAPVTLVTSELVTNAVEHADTVMTLQARLRPGRMYVAVVDGSDGVPARVDGGRFGRGLDLVALMSTRWGHLPRPGGKVVWASFSTRTEPPR